MKTNSGSVVPLTFHIFNGKACGLGVNVSVGWGHFG